MSTTPKTPPEKTYACENCAVRYKAEANPKKLFSRIWKWHTGWCPGWKAYQRHLAQKPAP